MNQKAISDDKNTADQAVKKKKRLPAKKTAAVIAGILAVLLVAGAAGGGIAYTVRGKLPDAAVPEAFSAGLSADDTQRTNAADTRIMSANLLVHMESWGGSDAAPRAKMFLEVLNTYTPDVVGLQEVSSQWFCCLGRNLPENYRFAGGFADGLFARYTCLIYNTATLKLVKHGSQKYTQGTDSRMRRMEWGLFERLDNGKQFVVSSTHFDLLHDGKIEEELPILQSEAQELLAFAEEMQNTYQCPVILTGDYNAMDDTPYTRDVDAKEIYLTLAAGLQDAKNAAWRAKSGNGWSLSEPVYDHIFLQGDVKIERFRLLSDLYMKDMSDHYPIFADFAIV